MVMTGATAAATAGAAVSALLAKLDALLLEGNCKSKEAIHITFLRDELQQTQHFFREFLESEHNPDGKSYWRRLRELSYDIEDTVDAITVKQQQQPSSGLLKSSHRSWRSFTSRILEFPNRVLFRLAMLDQLQELKSRLKELISDLKDRYRYRCRTKIRRSAAIPRITVDASSCLVGVDSQRDRLVKLLLEVDEKNNDPRRVLSILGYPGVGKTTLARQVFCKIQPYLDCVAWVSMSSYRSVTNILEDILCQVDDGVQVDRYVSGAIRESLAHKRYLVVVDGICNPYDYFAINMALPCNSLGSRVITTTRFDDVAEYCYLGYDICDMRILYPDDSLKLLHGRIFGSEAGCHPHLVEISYKIVRDKCCGYPMAISIISGLLAYKPRTRLVWEGVCNSIPVDQASLYIENGEGMRKILSLGYRDLPQHLKVCLLHLSIFPRDYPISRGRVIRSWIAEGFITISENSSHATVEEVAETYLDELINRGFIQPVVSGSDDSKAEACLLICGTVHEFIESKAAKESVGTILGDENKLSVLCGMIRRLSVMNLKENFDDIPESTITSHIRSLYTFVLGSRAKLSYKHFPFLRVLDLEGFKELRNNNVEEIARRLLNLRYLSIQGTPVSKIPDQIGQLQFLTTLDLRGTEVQELPMSVVHLRRLAHLLCDTMKFPAEWIGKMTKLSCLSQFDVLQCSMSSVEQLGNLSELRELTLWWSPETEVDNIDERCEQLAFSLYRLRKLQSLYINGCDGNSVGLLQHLRHPLLQLHTIQLDSSCYVSRIPEWFRSLESLRHVCVNVEVLKNEDLQLLSELPSLFYLSLSSKYMATEKLFVTSNGFPVLQEFHLCSPRLNLTFEPQAMPGLQRLCVSLLSLPQPEETCGFLTTIDQLRCLKNICFRISSSDVDTFKLLEAMDAAVRKATEKHPNCPCIQNQIG